jgi:chemotaxis protein MotB
MGRRRRLTEGEGGGHDGGGSLRWLLTYADMITLLMAFFIMMYSMSILNLNKFRKVAVSIRSGFNGLSEGQGKSAMGASGQFSIKPAELTGDTSGVPWQVIQRIQKLVKEKDLQKSVKLRPDARGLVVSLVTDKVLFEKGGADLSPASQKLICSIADTLKGIPNGIQVEGHTCDLPIVSEKYPSNWELSTSRATNVVRCLIENAGLAPERLSAAGYADSKPLVPNHSEKNRAVNRRVDIVVLRIGGA